MFVLIKSTYLNLRFIGVQCDVNLTVIFSVFHRILADDSIERVGETPGHNDPIVIVNFAHCDVHWSRD